MKLHHLLFLLFALNTPALFAQPTPPSKEDVKKAKTLAADGKTAFESELYEKALALFQEAYGLNPKPGYLANIGQSFSSLGRYQEALDAYQKFLEQAPADDPLRAAVEQEISKTKQTLASLKDSASLSAKATAEKAFKEADYKSAIDAYYEAYSLGPKPEYLIRIGQCHENLGQSAEAAAAYRSYLEKTTPDDPLRSSIEANIEKLDAKKPATEAAPVPVGPSPLPPKLILIGEVAATSGGMVGVLALASAFKLKDLADLESNTELDPTNIKKQHNRLRAFSAISDLLLVAGAASAGAGLYLRKQEKRAKMELSVAPGGVVATIQY